jgi:hypothetical protein
MVEIANLNQLLREYLKERGSQFKGLQPLEGPGMGA